MLLHFECLLMILVAKRHLIDKSWVQQATRHCLHGCPLTVDNHFERLLLGQLPMLLSFLVMTR